MISGEGKCPLYRRSVTLPRTKTRGRVLNLASRGEKIQKHRAATQGPNKAPRGADGIPGHRQSFRRRIREASRSAVYLKRASHVLARNWPIPRSDLRDLQFRGILIVEQIDVRDLLLADSFFRSLSGSPHSSANRKYFFT